MKSTRRLKRLCQTALLGLLALQGAPSMAAADTVILVPQEVIDGFKDFRGSRQVADIRNYELQTDYIGRHQDPFINLEVIELVLLVQALQLGGLKGEIKIKPASSHAMMKKVEKGDALLGGVSIWSERTDNRSKTLWVSDPIIRQGEFELGLYSCGQPVPIVDMADLRQYKLSSHADWPMVTELLQSLEQADLSLSSDWATVVKQGCNGMSDLVAAPFTNSSGLSLQHLEQLLTPVPGVKLQVGGTRHFVISRLHPKGKRTYFSLQRGLRKLRQKGNIARAMRQSGFLHRAAAGWTLLNK